MPRPSMITVALLAFILSVHVAAPLPLHSRTTEDADELRQLGIQSFRDGHYREAEQYLQQALQAFTTAGKQFSGEVADILGELASVLTEQERYSEAEALLQHGLQIMKARNSDRRGTPVLLGNLGTVYQRTGRFPAAEATFTEAIRLAEKHLGGEHWYMAVLLSNLGSVYSQTGNNKVAERQIRKALNIVEKLFGSDSVKLEPILVNLAAVYQKQKKWSSAELLLTRTLALVEGELGRQHPNVSFVLEHLGVVHFRQKKLAAAETELRRALEIEREVQRTEGVRIASLSFYLARVLAGEKKYDEAATLYGTALALQERRFGLKAPEVAATLEEYAKLLHNVKSNALAQQMELRARQIRAENAYTVHVGQ